MINYNEQSANFTLRTTDIHSYDGIGASSYEEVWSSPIGEITGYGTDVTFHLDLENIVGEEVFKNHKYFHLTMSNFMTLAYSNGTGFSTNKPFQNDVNVEYMTLNVWLSNPTFRLSSYNVETQNNEKYSHLGIIGRNQYRVSNSGVTEQLGNWRNDEVLYSSIATYPNKDIIIEKQKNISFRITFSPTTSNLKTIPYSNDIFRSGATHSMQHFIANFSLTPVK